MFVVSRLETLRATCRTVVMPTNPVVNRLEDEKPGPRSRFFSLDRWPHMGRAIYVWTSLPQYPEGHIPMAYPVPDKWANHEVPLPFRHYLWVPGMRRYGALHASPSGTLHLCRRSGRWPLYASLCVPPSHSLLSHQGSRIVERTTARDGILAP